MRPLLLWPLSSSSLVVLLGSFVTLTVLASAAYRGPPRLTDSYQRRYSGAVGSTMRLACPIVQSNGFVLSSSVDDHGGGASNDGPDDAATSGSTLFYSWTKDGRPIHDGWPRHRPSGGSEPGSGGRMLRIKDLEPDDAGVYRCQATNGFGTAQATLLVQVHGGTSSAGNETEPLEVVSAPEASLPDTWTGQQLPASVINLTATSTSDQTEAAPTTDGASSSWPLSADIDDDIIDSEQNPRSRCVIRLRNTTATIGQAATIDCHVTCVERLAHAEWYKQVDGSTSGGRRSKPTIRIGDQRFTAVRHTWTTREKVGSWRPDPDDMEGDDGEGRWPSLNSGMAYVSRLAINSAMRRDNGKYACVSVDQDGRRTNYGTGFLTVFAENFPNHEQTADDHSRPRYGQTSDVVIVEPSRRRQQQMTATTLRHPATTTVKSSTYVSTSLHTSSSLSSPFILVVSLSTAIVAVVVVVACLARHLRSPLSVSTCLQPADSTQSKMTPNTAAAAVTLRPQNHNLPNKFRSTYCHHQQPMAAAPVVHNYYHVGRPSPAPFVTATSSALNYCGERIDRVFEGQPSAWTVSMSSESVPLTGGGRSGSDGASWIGADSTSGHVPFPSSAQPSCYSPDGSIAGGAVYGGWLPCNVTPTSTSEVDYTVHNRLMYNFVIGEL